MSSVISPSVKVTLPSSHNATGELGGIDATKLLPVTLRVSLATEAATLNDSVSGHRPQEDNNTLHSHAITTPPPSHHPNAISVVNDECHYTLTQCSPVEESNDLNHASLFELLENQHRLPFEKRRCVQILDNKRLYGSTRYQIPNYFSQCCLMMLLDQNIATQVCLCGNKSKRVNGTNPTGLCRRNRFCPPCANLEVRKTLRTFQPGFHHHRWGWLTISYDGHLPLNHLSGSEWSLYWDAAKSALQRLETTRVVEGAMWREELAIPSLSPTTAMPHLHAIVPTDNLSPEALKRLASWVKGHRDDLGDGIELEPSADFRPIPTEDDFVRVVQYLHKPIDLVTPYASRWDANASIEDKMDLNRFMRDLIESTILLPKGRKQIDYCGNMRASSKAIFIGVPRSERQ